MTADANEIDIAFDKSLFYDEGVDRLFPRWTRKHRLAKALRKILNRGETWWKYSVYSPREWKYRLKMRFWVKPNKIHVKYFPNDRWTDRCSLIRHAVFQILVDFVEKERPFEHFDTEDSHHKEEWLELRSLYEWYKNFKEFDSVAYQEKLLGYNPYERRPFEDNFTPVEEYGLDDWGDPKMYSWDSDSTEEETVALFATLEEEKKWEDDFTRRAMRVVELWKMLWT